MRVDPVAREIQIDLTQAKDCRWYIEYFRKQIIGRPIQFVELVGGERVYLDRMSDEQAISIANDFFNMAKEAAFQRRGIQ